MDKKIEFIYKFTIFEKQIMNEELVVLINKSKNKVFSRNFSKITLGTKFSDPKLRKFSGFINENQLFLTKIVKDLCNFHLNDDEFSNNLDENFLFDTKNAKFTLNEILQIYFFAFDYFSNYFVCDFKTNLDLKLAKTIQENQDKILELLKVANFKISNIFVSFLDTSFKIYIEKETLPGKYFDLLTEESCGTVDFVFTLAKILYSQKANQLLIIDDFAQNLHPKLTILLLRIIQNLENPQVLLSSHCTYLLNSKIFTTEQIIFVGDDFGNLTCKKLSDFKGFRDNMNAEKYYIQGRFCNSPFIIISDNGLKQILDHE